MGREGSNVLSVGLRLSARERARLLKPFEAQLLEEFARKR